MRLSLSGTTQSLYSLCVAAFSGWQHVNGQQVQIYFPDQTIEAGNAGASVKIGNSALTTDTTGVDDVLTEGDRKFLPSQGDGMNRVSLKNTYVRGSAAATIIFLEHHIG